jgi:phosphate transport system substrate-binding protein
MMIKNNEAVSPIVATLVLIVVAIVGAAAVGLLMGSFSNNVADQANSGDVAGSASNTILIAGSTTLYPANVILAQDYSASHQGVKVTVQEGGSDAGIVAAGNKVADIGASSKYPDAKYFTTYPSLKTYELGGSAVVVIGSSDVANSVTKADLQSLYNVTAAQTATTQVDNVTTVCQRAEGSGTEEVFAKYLGFVSSLDNAFVPSGVTMASVTGNDGMLAKVQTTSHCLGFVDWGYVDSAAKLGAAHVLTVDGKTANATTIKAELKALNGANYVTSLTKKLYFVTNGEPNSMVKDFINYAQSPAGAAAFTKAGMFSSYDLI